MNKLAILLVTSILASGCQFEDVKNKYSISGIIGIDGTIYGIENLTITLLSNDQIIEESEGAEYHFDNLEEGKPYTILPRVTIGSNTGVSTLDWVVIDKYINGLQELDVFQKIAADVDRSGDITTADLDRVVACIVSSDCFSWRFASADYDGAGQGYIDQYEIPRLYSDRIVDFVPIKLGDVNNTIIH